MKKKLSVPKGTIHNKSISTLFHLPKSTLFIFLYPLILFLYQSLKWVYKL